jgi:hypothetical protein
MAQERLALIAAMESVVEKYLARAVMPNPAAPVVPLKPPHAGLDAARVAVETVAKELESWLAQAQRVRSKANLS